MKRLILIFILFPTFAFSQKVVDVVELSNGEVIVVYDDKTWTYPADIKNKTTSQAVTSPSVTPVSSTTPKPTSTKSLYTAPRVTPSSSSTSSQCTGTTQKGARCKRMVRGGGRCYQH